MAMGFATLFAMGVALFASGSQAQGTCSSPDAQVLILGAGMSGVSAARKLYDSSVSFIILEARDKVGGRMRAVSFAGATVEVGANWIHGVDTTMNSKYKVNPVWDLRTKAGLQTVKDAESLKVYNASGGSSDISVRTALNSAGWVPQTSPETLFADYFSFDSDAATRPENVSLYGWKSESTFEDFGDSNYLVVDPRGYEYLVQFVGQSFLNTNALHLNTTVTSVTYSDGCVCADVVERGQIKTYCGRQGVWKIDAISKFLLPLYLKVFVAFNETFWSADAGFNFIGRAVNDPDSFAYTLVVPIGQLLPNNPSILLFIVTGNAAYRVASQNVSVTRQELLNALRSVYGNFRATVVDILVPDWASNSLYYGSYSTARVGITADTFTKLASPVQSLYFSGEATSMDYQGSVHGAYLSGMETADSIVNSGYAHGLSFVPAFVMLLAAIVF
ncbi:hypothetical protein EMCRGX_G011136 [Ephydatia muelleri]